MKLDKDTILSKVSSKFLEKNSRNMIKKLFIECEDKFRLPGIVDVSGFLGIEDLESNITIQFSIGSEKYFHLSKREGFTGTQYELNKSAIFSKNHIGSLKPTDIVKDPPIGNEMVSIIHFIDEEDTEHKVGVIMLDRPKSRLPFSQHDLKILDSITNKISGIISDKEPWGLRDWWKNYEIKCLNYYKHNLINKIQNSEITVKEVDSITSIDVLSNEFKNEKLINLKGGIAEIKKIDELVLNNGVYEMFENNIVTDLISIPFPSKGPIKGIIKVKRSKENSKEYDKNSLTDIAKKISEIIENYEYPLFNMVFNKEIGTRIFSIVNISDNLNMTFSEKIHKIWLEFTKIHSATFNIYLNEDEISIKEDNENIKLISAKDLSDLFNTSGYKTSRPRFWEIKNKTKQNKTDALRCGIHYGNLLISVIEAKLATGDDSNKDEIEAQWDGQIIEGLASLIEKAFSLHRRFEIIKKYFNEIGDNISEIDSYYGNFSMDVLESDFVYIFESKDSNIRKIYSHGLNEETFLKVDVLFKLLNEIERKTSKILNLYHIDNSQLDFTNIRSLLIYKIPNSNRYFLTGLYKRKHFIKLKFDNLDEINLATISTSYHLVKKMLQNYSNQ